MGFNACFDVIVKGGEEVHARQALNLVNAAHGIVIANGKKVVK